MLILLHNDPDPDAMASGLALRSILRRTKATAILGTLQGVTRPENLRMASLLDIQVEAVTPASLGEFDRVAMVDVQPHYFGELFGKVDLVIDHHPLRSGYVAVFKDIRPDYGSTSTILTEHLRAVDVSISERTATALLYAIKSDTLFFNRQANRVDLEAFSFLYPLSDATLIRKMEGAEITHERLEFVMKALEAGRREDQVFCGVHGADAARGPGRLRRRLLPAAGGHPVDRSSAASSTTCSSCRSGTWATPGTPASGRASTSRRWAARAGTGRWPRPWCPWRRSASSSGRPRGRTSASGSST